MNILFIHTGVLDPNNGGIERVSNVLADYFERNGSNIWYLTLNNNTGLTPHPERQLFFPNKEKWNTEENKSFFSNLIKDKQISICINQQAFYITEEYLEFILIAKASGCSIVSVYHNSLIYSIKQFHFTLADKTSNLIFRKLTKVLTLPIIRHLLYILWSLRNSTRRKLHKKLGEVCDSIVLLSKGYLQEYFYLTLSRKLLKKISAIANPCPFKDSLTSLTSSNSKEILYLGRINNKQKRVDLLLQVWGLLWKRHTDWKLTLVGDGLDMKNCMEYSKELGLQNIYFEGKQDPIKYYQRASILCMTSRFEGFPMVLPEAMHFSVVPIVFNSYPAVTDIISDQKDGLLIKPFNINEYAKKLEMLIVNKSLREQLSVAAKEKSKQFSTEEICAQWMRLLKDLVKKQKLD